MLILLGVVVVGAAAGYVAYLNGAFKSHEKIAILTWNKDPFWDLIDQGAADAAKDYGATLTFVQSEPDVTAQNAHVKELLDASNAALAISPHDPKAQQSVLNDAAGRAVVVTFDSDAPDTKRRAYVGTDDYAAGQIAAEEVRDALPAGGKVIVSVGSIDMSNGRDRRQGLIDDLLDRPHKRDNPTDPLDAPLDGKTYQVVATVVDNGDAAKAAQGLADALKAHPDANCVVGLFSYSGVAAVNAVDTAGKKGQVKIVGFDETPDEQAAVQSGAIYSSVVQNQYRCGYETVRVMTELLRGTQAAGPAGPRTTQIPVTVMKADNIDALRQARVIRTPRGNKPPSDPGDGSCRVESALCSRRTCPP